MWAKLKSPFTGTGELQIKERDNNLSSKLNVNEEYKNAFRTKSYMDMWCKVEEQLGRRSMEQRLSLSSPPSSSSASVSFYVQLSEYLLEPQQETLMNMIGSLQVHELLINYFEASLDAYHICELLLRSVHQTRANYRRIQRVVKISKKVKDCRAISRHLGAFASLTNPLSIVSPVQFHDNHHSNMLLLKSLTLKCKKIRRRLKFRKILKKVGAYSLVISHSALIVAMLVLLLPSMVGVVAAPGFMTCLVLLKRRTIKKLVRRGGIKTSLLERLVSQLDVAAKGVYILINDFDTISRMVKRLHDEVEYRKDVANMCVRNGKSEMLKEVLKEFHVHESSFLEQLKELEDHIYLCFLTINRSRRLVLQEILTCQPKT
ncbi:hypothetical protein EZV62_021179 [Acer yangbiense]|uniref:Uncharacterized protein n=1 Tax=Acer yangbiense TaxID=1000413 RepID=A0A5C7H4W8_9ROSI|nr:hypothetical protein EZV62_021179 [Acer yangbiense]